MQSFSLCFSFWDVVLKSVWRLLVTVMHKKVSNLDILQYSWRISFPNNGSLLFPSFVYEYSAGVNGELKDDTVDTTDWHEYLP